MFFSPKVGGAEERSVVFRLDVDDVIAFFRYDRSRASPFAPPPDRPNRRRREPTSASKFLIWGFVFLVVLGILMAPPQAVDAVRRFCLQFLGVIAGVVLFIIVALVNSRQFNERLIRKEFAR